MVPPPAFKVPVRAELKEARACKPPPSKLSPPAVLPKFPSPLTATTPPFMATPPSKVLVPDKVNFPVPVLVSKPTPDKALLKVRSYPLVSMVPPPAFKLPARAELKAANACKVPPSKLSAPAASPKFPSLLTATTPPFMATPPSKVFTPDKVKTPVPVLLNEPVPEKTPLKVRSYPLVSMVPPPAFTVPVRVKLRDVKICKAPPSKLSVPLTLPKFPSPFTATTPPFRVRPPV